MTFNIFAFQRGVLDRLLAENAEKGMKVVFLTPQIHVQHLARYAKRDDVVIEVIEKYDSRSTLTRIFQFFYSYLIFTDTTRLLATFGARADLPPAGGNRHLAPLKGFIANTFGRSRWIKTVLVPWIYQALIRKRPYRYLFEKYHPDLVFVTNLVDPLDLHILTEAKRHKVKTVGMAMNWDHLNKYYIPLHTDLFLAQNNQMRDEAVNLHAYRPDQVTVVGFPQFDIYASWKDYLIPRKEFFSHFGISPESRFILYISGSVYALDEPDILQAISGWVKEGKLGADRYLMLRPYVQLRDKDVEERKYGAFKSDPSVIFNWQKTDNSEEGKRFYMSMMGYADIIISAFSTTAIEAALLDKPTITIGFDGYKKRPPHESIARLEKLEHFKHVFKTGGVSVARSFPELQASIEGYLKDPEQDKEKRRMIVEKFCYQNDGLASYRIAAFLKRQVLA